MAQNPELWQPLLDRLGALRSAWPGSAWTWDPRFKCVAASFGKEIADKARLAMAPVLSSEWAAETIASAPADVQSLAGRYGGVRSGQLLFVGDLIAGMRSFGLWWPWGDAATISLRIGVANCDRPTELYPQVRAVFGIG